MDQVEIEIDVGDGDSLSSEEVELSTREADLVRETSRLSALAGALFQRVATIHGGLAETEAMGVDGQPLRERLSRLQMPEPDAGTFAEDAQELRRRALDVRASKAQALEQQVMEWRLALEALDEELAYQLSELEKAKLRARPSSSARRFPRVPMKAAVEFRSGDRAYHGTSTNVSSGGMFISTSTTVALGSEVAVLFTVPGGGQVLAKGVTRWRREPDPRYPEAETGIGVQFERVNDLGKVAITRYVAKRVPILLPG
ncbi:MAG: PilZ domain-containing protein [Myxococcaceae bacterium]